MQVRPGQYNRGTPRNSTDFTSTASANCRVKWQDKVPDTEILEQTGISSTFTMLRKIQLCWAGHVVRMPDERLPKRILYGELLTGARSHGGKKKRFKDTLKASLKDFGIDHSLWETTAQNRTAWRGAINKGAAAYESRRLQTAKSKRATRKPRTGSASGTLDPTALPCPHFPRSFKAKIGFTWGPAPPPDMKRVFFPQVERTHLLWYDWLCDLCVGHGLCECSARSHWCMLISVFVLV